MQHLQLQQHKTTVKAKTIYVIHDAHEEREGSRQTRAPHTHTHTSFVHFTRTWYGAHRNRVSVRSLANACTARFRSWMFSVYFIDSSFILCRCKMHCNMNGWCGCCCFVCGARLFFTCAAVCVMFNWMQNQCACISSMWWVAVCVGTHKSVHIMCMTGGAQTLHINP